MRIGVIVDGWSEQKSLPKLFPRLEEAANCVLVGPLKADIQPYADVDRIGWVCRKSVAIVEGWDVESIVIVFDREGRNECPGVLAEIVRRAVAPAADVPLAVVIKDRTFENWLISDCAAIRAHPRRFNLGAAAERTIVPNMADHVNAEHLIKAAIRGHSYHKVKDSTTILESADPLRMASNSRSFRRFLRCIGHPTYAEQSKSPAQ